MAEQAPPSVANADVLASLKSLEEQLKDQRKVQASILQQLSAVQQATITGSRAPDDSGLPPTTSSNADEASGKRNFHPA